MKAKRKILYDGLIKGSHSSIYLQDKESKEDAGEIWNTKATPQQIAHPGRQVVGISIPRYGETYLTLRLCSARPVFFKKEVVDHCNEFSIEIANQLEVGNFFTGFIPLPIPPGIYRARVIALFLNTVKNENEGEDKFVIDLWPDTEHRELVIVQ
jgi:hypothetical protein